MFNKISVNDLRAGMFVVDTDVSWLKHPYLYSVEGLLATSAEIDRIRSDGYLETFIDLTRCAPGSLPFDLAQLVLPGQGAAPPAEYTPPPPRVPLAEELRAARSIYRASLFQAKEMMDNMRKGIFDMPQAEPVVDSILESLDRNADALVGLCKLRQTDDYTYTHCVNVSVLTVMLARGLGATGDKLHAIGMGGLFHDLGKALIPLRVLNAPRKLSDEEFAIMRRHPLLGYEQIKEVQGVPPEVLQIVLEHHEKHNGQGYPRGLSGADISFAGQISSLVDVFDALSSRRVYKEALPLSKALSIMYSMRDKDFAGAMLERFIRLLGVYPVGSAVELEDGRYGVVASSNPAQPLHPTVILVRDKEGKALERKVYDLAATGAPAIARSASAQELGADPGIVLGLPPTA